MVYYVKMYLLIKGTHVKTSSLRKLPALLLFLLYSSFSAYSYETVKAGYTDDCDFLYENEGSYYGYAYEYLNEIAKYTGWQYEFVKGTKKECYDRIISGEIDIFPGFKKTPAAEDMVLFSSRNIGSWPLMLFSRPDNSYYSQFNDFSKFDTAVIGYPKGAESFYVLEEKCREEGIHPVFKEYDDINKLKTALINREADLIFFSSIHNDPELRSVASFSPELYYIGVSKKKSEILDELETALDSIQTRDTYFTSDLHKKYYSNIRSAVHELTSDEKYFIQTSPFVKVTISSVYPPIDAADSVYGSSILMSILDLISEKTGLQFSYIISSNNEVSSQNIIEGKAQVMAAVFNDFRWVDSRGMYMTKPVLPIHLYEVHNKNEKPSDKKVTYVITKEYFESKVISQTGNILILPDLYGCLKAVNEGKIDRTYTNLYALLYFSHQNGFSNLSYNGSSVSVRELCLGVSKTADRRLLSIINKGIALITDEELQQVIYKNTILHTQKGSLKNLIRNRSLEFSLILFLFVSALTAVIFLIILNHLRKQKNLALEKAARAKSDFLARMSHEIRTPLTAIIGINEMAMQKNTADPTLSGYLDKIDTSSKHLLQLINDILDMSKITEGKMYLKKSVFSLSGILQAIYTVYHPMAEKSNILLSIQKQSALPDSYIGDSLRIKEVLINLISNAIKYNKKEGVVTLAVEIIPSKEEKKTATLRFTVSDTGIGIHKKILDTIFEPFERDDLADVRQISGSGLGLSLSQKILELMDSTIQVTSVPGIGSTFWFDLELPVCPDEKVLQPAKTDKPLCSLEGRRLIIAEDNDLNAEIIEDIIVNLHPAECIRVKNGKECAVVFEKSAEFYYDTIIMDIRMPVMDGYKATKYIRSLPRADAKKVHIIALSANAYIEDIELSLESGMNAHCSKPIDKQELQIALMAGA